MASQPTQPNPPSAPPVVTPSRPRPERERLERVIIRSFPKAIYFYPTFLAAVLAGIFTSADVGKASLWGTIFLAVFTFNVIVMAFEFPRTTSLTIVFIVVAGVLGAILLNQGVTFLPALKDATEHLAPEANAQFYWLIALILGAAILVMLIIHRFIDYWEVFSNELIHHHGMLGNLERFPAPGIKLEKEITDVFEFFILGAGRLVITVPSEGRAIVLDNVPRINRVERDIKSVLGVTEVEINPT